MSSSFTAAGSLADYTPAVQTSIKQRFAASAGVDPEAVTLTITQVAARRRQLQSTASVSIQVDIVTPTP